MAGGVCMVGNRSRNSPLVVIIRWVGGGRFYFLLPLPFPVPLTFVMCIFSLTKIVTYSKLRSYCRTQSVAWNIHFAKHRKHYKVLLMSFFIKKIVIEFLTRILHRAGAGMGNGGWKYKNVGCYSDSSAVSAAEGGGGGEGGEKKPSWWEGTT